MASLPPPNAPPPTWFRRAVARVVGAVVGIAWLGFFGWLLVERTDQIGAWVKKQGGGLQLPLDDILSMCCCGTSLLVLASAGFLAGFVSQLIAPGRRVDPAAEDERAG